jgi:hypothetical protein
MASANQRKAAFLDIEIGDPAQYQRELQEYEATVDALKQAASYGFKDRVEVWFQTFKSILPQSVGCFFLSEYFSGIFSRQFWEYFDRVVCLFVDSFFPVLSSELIGFAGQRQDMTHDEQTSFAEFLASSQPSLSIRMQAPPSLSAGRIELELFEQESPKACENFLALVRTAQSFSVFEPLMRIFRVSLQVAGNKGIGKVSGKLLHYKGSSFHRIVPGFMAQGGVSILSLFPTRPLNIHVLYSTHLM